MVSTLTPTVRASWTGGGRARRGSGATTARWPASLLGARSFSPDRPTRLAAEAAPLRSVNAYREREPVARRVSVAGTLPNDLGRVTMYDSHVSETTLMLADHDEAADMAASALVRSSSVTVLGRTPRTSPATSLLAAMIATGGEVGEVVRVRTADSGRAFVTYSL